MPATTTKDLTKVISIDVANQFTQEIGRLVELLGITKQVPLAEGSVIKVYSGYDVTLDEGNGVVEEGSVIPLSQVKAKAVKNIELAIKKYRKQVTGEAITRFGFNEAINNTDLALIREVQKGFKKGFFELVATGTGTADATGKGLQGAVAGAWGKLQDLFEDTNSDNIIVFANPMDVAKYLGEANIQSQTAFGLTFLNAFLNATIIATNQVAQGTIYATVADNILLAYVDTKNSEIARTFELVSDETGLVGLAHTNDTQTFSVETLLITGIGMYVQRLDGIVKVTVAGK